MRKVTMAEGSLLSDSGAGGSAIFYSASSLTDVVLSALRVKGQLLSLIMRHIIWLFMRHLILRLNMNLPTLMWFNL